MSRRLPLRTLVWRSLFVVPLVVALLLLFFSVWAARDKRTAWAVFNAIKSWDDFRDDYL